MTIRENQQGKLTRFTVSVWMADWFVIVWTACECFIFLSPSDEVLVLLEWKVCHTSNCDTLVSPRFFFVFLIKIIDNWLPNEWRLRFLIHGDKTMKMSCNFTSRRLRRVIRWNAKNIQTFRAYCSIICRWLWCQCLTELGLRFCAQHKRNALIRRRNKKKHVQMPWL